MKRIGIMVAATAFAAVSVYTIAAEPQLDGRTIPYQGYLELNGAPAPGDLPVSMIFELTDGNDSANSWTETHPGVVLSNGRFSVSLGSVAGGVPSWAFTTEALDLRIAVGNGDFLANKQRIQAVPYAVRADSAIKKGHIGEIRYSMLDKDKFQALYGMDWTLMDGICDGLDMTEYTAATGQPCFPDVRGNFLRAKNNGRTEGNFNPEGDLDLGAPQGYQIQTHNHDTQINTYTGASCNIRGASGGNACGSTKVTTHTGGAETRPMNVTVNVFIKYR